MKKSILRILSLALCLALCTSLAAPASAADGKISRISLTIAAPRADEKPSYELTIPDGSHFHAGNNADENWMNGVWWGSSWLPADGLEPGVSSFQAGEVYVLKLCLAPDDGYEFDFGIMQASVNGCEAEAEPAGGGMLSLSVPFRASGAILDSGVWGDGFQWQIDKSGVMTVTGTGDIPASEEGYPWSSYNFYTLELGEGVTGIPNNCFAENRSLAEIKFPSTLRSIGRSAFAGCEGLTQVLLPSALREIGADAFNGCRGLAGAALPAGLEFIEENAFSNTGLESVAIPSSTSMGDNPFTGCSRLTDITVSAASESYSSSDGVLYSRDGTELVIYPEGRKDSVFTVPDGVTGIRKMAFYGNGTLTEVILPDGLTRLGDHAFYECGKLESVRIPDGVTKIPPFCFALCRALSAVELPDGLKSIGESAFLACRMRAVKLPSGLEWIDTYAFDNCTELNELDLPAGLHEAGPYAFFNCRSLREITIPDGWTELTPSLFQHCDRLERVTIPASVTMIERSAFAYCDMLKDVYYGGSEAQWARIDVRNGNESLLDAEIHFGSAARWGDVDGSGVVDTDDAMLILRYDVKKIGAEKLKNFALADVDGSGVVDSDDAMLILRYDVKKIAKFPAEG